MNQVDITPSSSGNTTGITIHVPAGQSASSMNNPTDFPYTAPRAASTTITKTVSGARFSNPS